MFTTLDRFVTYIHTLTLHIAKVEGQFMHSVEFFSLDPVCFIRIEKSTILSMVCIKGLPCSAFISDVLFKTWDLDYLIYLSTYRYCTTRDAYILNTQGTSPKAGRARLEYSYVAKCIFLSLLLFNITSTLGGFKRSLFVMSIALKDVCHYC